MEPGLQPALGRVARPAQKTRAVILAGAGLEWLALVVRREGLQVEEVKGRYDAIAAVADDPAGYWLVVQVCDDAEGLQQGQKSASLLRSIAPGVAVMLLIAEEPTGVQDAGCRKTCDHILWRRDIREIAGQVLARVWQGHGARPDSAR